MTPTTNAQGGLSLLNSGEEVKPEHCVRSKCCNSKCINPYHLCLTTKDTTLPLAARQTVEALIRQRSPGTIKQLLHEALYRAVREIDSKNKEI